MMTNCEYCDYYQVVSSDASEESLVKELCSFADVILLREAEKPHLEYPCRNTTYQQYQDRQKKFEGTSKLKPEDWKLIYKSRHPIAERSRSRYAV